MDDTNTKDLQKETWENYFQKLYQKEDGEHTLMGESCEGGTHIDPNLVANLAKALKNRKTPGLDNIRNEMIKYGEEKLHV